MPTPKEAFAVVAATLEDFDPGDEVAVQRFYKRTFLTYPAQAQTLISYFLICATSVPSETILKRLKKKVAKIQTKAEKLDDPLVGCPC